MKIKETHIINSIPFQYARDVQSGKIVTGKWIKLAVERFYQWIDESPESGYHLNHNYGMIMIDFFEKHLIHTVGKSAGKPFILSPYQQFTIYNVFGWIDKNGNRRIREVYDTQAKKGGKTAVMAGLALGVMALDGEAGAQVYVGATKEDQARICVRQAKAFVNWTNLNQEFNVFQKGVKLKKDEQTFIMPLGGDSKTHDGIEINLE
jgi:phage terminase large subunit-like protein